ncbi:MAG: hypothetical protein IJ079_03610 [Lachnospiraceae bacterium]|nr:hypothetical protein [Lachnospiraceae bacterium]
MDYDELLDKEKEYKKWKTNSTVFLPILVVLMIIFGVILIKLGAIQSLTLIVFFSFTCRFVLRYYNYNI